MSSNAPPEPRVAIVLASDLKTGSRRGTTVARALALLVIAAIIGIFGAAAAAPYSWLGSTLLQRSHESVNYSEMWEVLGTNTTELSGPRELIGTTLLLGNTNAGNVSRAQWSIQLNTTIGPTSRTANATVYVPASLTFGSTALPLQVLVGGQQFNYTPTNETNVSWHVGPVFLPYSNQTVRLPSPFRSSLPDSYTFIAVPFNLTVASQIITVTIEVPPGGQIYVPLIPLVTFASSESIVSPSTLPLGVLCLGFFLAGAVSAFYLSGSSSATAPQSILRS